MGKKEKKKNKDSKEVEELRQALDKSKQEAELYLNQLRRLKADYENYRKRMEKVSSGNYEEGKKTIAKDLLVVLDNFERALSEEKLDKEGINLVNKEFFNILRKKGVERMEALNSRFDPNLHHAVNYVERDNETEEKVVEVLQPGYLWKNAVLRPAMVVVSKPKEEE